MSRSFRQMRRAVCLVVSLWSVGCKVDTSSRMVTLRNAIVPSKECAFAPDNASITEGYYDPWVNNAGGAVFGFLAENYAGATEDEKVGAAPAGFVENVETHRHDVQVEGVEGCWFVTNGLNAPSYAPRSDGSMVDCATLPAAQSRLQLAGITLDEGSTYKTSRRSVVSVRALDLADMRALFGQSFDPANVPVVGDTISTNVSYNAAVAGQPQNAVAAHAYSYATAEPSDLATRSAAWGENYPTSRQADIVFQIRVTGRMLSGGKVHSNWLLFPVTLCPGCLRDACGPLVQKVCGRGTCTDGTPCMDDGTCAAGSPIYCTPIAVYSGMLPNFNVTGNCLPAQAYPGSVGPTCEGVGCDGV